MKLKAGKAGELLAVKNKIKWVSIILKVFANHKRFFLSGFGI